MKESTLFVLGSLCAAVIVSCTGKKGGEAGAGAAAEDAPPTSADSPSAASALGDARWSATIDGAPVTGAGVDELQQNNAAYVLPVSGDGPTHSSSIRSRRRTGRTRVRTSGSRFSLPPKPGTFTKQGQTEHSCDCDLTLNENIAKGGTLARYWADSVVITVTAMTATRVTGPSWELCPELGHAACATEAGHDRQRKIRYPHGDVEDHAGVGGRSRASPRMWTVFGELRPCASKAGGDRGGQLSLAPTELDTWYYPSKRTRERLARASVQMIFVALVSPSNHPHSGIDGLHAHSIDARLAQALIGRYVIGREIGAGGMATVWLAHDVKHDRSVAVKVLHPQLAAHVGAERFLKEIRTTAQLQHPHILPLFDSGEADGLLYYVMPYVEGESLRHCLQRDQRLPVVDAVRISAEIASALDHAHRHGVIHRDIKPENISSMMVRPSLPTSASRSHLERATGASPRPACRSALLHT